MATEPTVFIVDDDQNIRESVRRLMESVGLAVEGHRTAQEFLSVHDATKPGCLLLEVRLPGLNGLDFLEQLAAQGVSIPAIIVTAHGDVPTAVRAMKAGAIDFIEKPFKDQTLLDGVHRAIARDAAYRRQHEERLTVIGRADLLTPRERQVMDLVVAGKANKQIATQLGCSRKTVEVHRARVMEKMEAESLAALVRMAITLLDSAWENSDAGKGKSLLISC